jgi:SNF2 family DNA or RNA helicase
MRVEKAKVEKPEVKHTATGRALSGELYGHQKEAFEQFKDTTEMGIFGTMGVGKSCISLRIAGYKFKKGEIDQLLIIGPNQIHVQWYSQELPKWLDCPFDSQCLFGTGGAKEAYPFDDDPTFLKVVCVNIDTFSTPTKWKDITEWANAGRTFIILDEASTIKSISAQRTQRILYEFNNVVRHKKTIISSKPKSVARAILTGTPVTNGPMDLWSMMEFLRPNFFGRNYYSFQARYGMFTSLVVNDRVIKVPLSKDWWEAIKSITSFVEANALTGCSEDTFNTVHAQDHYEGPYKHAEELKELIKPVSWFKDIRDCMDMPKQNYYLRELVMSPAIEKCYDDMVEEMIAEYEGKQMTAKSKLTMLIRLQQISAGFICDKYVETEEEEDESDSRVAQLYGLADDRDIIPSEIQWIGSSNPKLDALYRDVDECAKPLIIATRFTAEASRIFEDLSTKYSCCLMTGWKRVGTVEEFQQGKYDIMVANSKVISMGFNLQNSHTILIYSNTFSLETRLQLEGRIFRIGQESPCEYIDYQYADSIDEKVVSALQLKRNLLEFIVGAENVKELVK